MDRMRWPATYKGVRRDILFALAELPDRRDLARDRALEQGAYDGDPTLWDLVDASSGRWSSSTMQHCTGQDPPAGDGSDNSGDDSDIEDNSDLEDGLDLEDDSDPGDSSDLGDDSDLEDGAYRSGSNDEYDNM
ncbi:hypothetical protein N657DRAFT_685219 [Parathielavia appendiculata]|uniref:Uncharacterized protein n=1 Tax=Parathielavia appendiculata TaxID=2587402 RepID=A0AAN6YY48_9PEZI|nr:hypothetical protein N657DRAFT_685219 [Parathielavia appendiculata]